MQAFHYSLLPVLLAAQLTGQSSETLPAAIGERIDAIAREAQKRQNIPAISLAVGHKGQVVYAKAFGKADLENDVAATPETRFRTASIAKSMTAVAAMRLWEQGKLDLDAPISKLCPEWKPKKWPITCRELLGHLGGIRHYKVAGESAGTKFFPTLAATLELFADDPLVAEPGTRFSYTTYGYTLLGLAIEKASGMGYADYLEQSVWKPAGMSDTCVDHHFRLVAHRARGYQKLDQRALRALPASARRGAQAGQVINAMMHDTSMKIPGGGLLSTPTDLVRFGLALIGDDLIERKTRKLMWTRQKTKSGALTQYGLGFGIAKMGDQRQIQHSGGQAGTSTLLVMLPEVEWVVAVMTNLRGASLRPTTAAVLETVKSR